VQILPETLLFSAARCPLSEETAIISDMPYKDLNKQQKYQAAWYQKNKKELQKPHKRALSKHREARRQWLRSLKEDKPCTDCGKTFHFSAMGWDHLPGATKLFCISSYLKLGQSKKKVLSEIAKCELVCANCHSIRTYKRSVQHRL
jgi:hypothetical protein